MQQAVPCRRVHRCQAGAVWGRQACTQLRDAVQHAPGAAMHSGGASSSKHLRTYARVCGILSRAASACVLQNLHVHLPSHKADAAALRATGERLGRGAAEVCAEPRGSRGGLCAHHRIAARGRLSSVCFCTVVGVQAQYKCCACYTCLSSSSYLCLALQFMVSTEFHTRRARS